jgi:hypothetical protein
LSRSERAVCTLFGFIGFGLACRLDLWDQRSTRKFWRESFVFAKSKVWKALPMAKVKYITSPDELPSGQNYVLVMYGEEYAQMRHPLGLTITVARQQSKTVRELSFLTAVHTAKGIAKQEGISNIFAYTSSD